MKKVRDSFIFIGSLLPIKDKDKKEILKPTDIVSSNTKWEGKSFTCQIDTGDNGRQRLKLFGGDNKKGNTYEDRVIKVGDDEITVPYKLRDKQEILDKLPRYVKRVVNIDGVKKEFLYQLDFINYVAENIKNFEGKKVKVMGDITYSYNNGTLYRDFNVNVIEEVSEDTKNQSNVTTQIYYKSNCIDHNLFNDNGKLDVTYLSDIGGKVNIDCFVQTRNTNKSIGVDDIFYPAKMIIDMTKVDFTNERASKIANFMVRNFMVDGDNIYTCAFDGKSINAQEQKSYTKEELEQLLTDEEKEYAELWGVSLDEVLARKQGDSVYGERINEIRLVKPNTGLPVKTISDDVTDDMLELYKTILTDTIKDVEKEETPKAQPKGAIEDDEFEGLFG